MSDTQTSVASLRKTALKIVQGMIRDGRTDEEIAVYCGVTANGARKWRGGIKPSRAVSAAIVAKRNEER